MPLITSPRLTIAAAAPVRTQPDAEDGCIAAPLLVGISDEDPEPAAAVPKASIFREILRPRCFLFLLLVLVMGTGYGVIDAYLFLYLEEIGGSEALMGATLTSASLGE